LSTVDEVKQRIDIVDVVSQYVTLQKSGRYLKGNCPFHNEKTPSFFVFPERQSWHCFGACNTGGDVFSFVMRQEGLDFGEALRLLAERVGVQVERRSPEDRDARERLYQVNESTCAYFQRQIDEPAARAARDYLSKREISPEMIQEFRLGYAPGGKNPLHQYLTEMGYTDQEMLAAGAVVASEDGNLSDCFRNRLIFPIVDIRGRVTGFGGRVLGDGNPKYLNTPQTTLFDKSGSLYAINLAAPEIRRAERAVLMEGYMDVIAAHQFGYRNVIAAMGTAVTERQIGAIKRLTRNLVLALDADAAGLEAMRRCVDYENLLEAEVRVVLLKGAKDPDEQIRRDPPSWPGLVDAAVPVLDHIFEAAATDLDFTTAAGKSGFAERLLPVLAGISDDIRRDHYINKLAATAGTNYSSVESALSRLKARRSQKQAARPKETAAELKPARDTSQEEYLLWLLLHHPELATQARELEPDIFLDTANREIFAKYLESADYEGLQTGLEVDLKSRLETIYHRDSTDGMDKGYADYRLKHRQTLRRDSNLEERYAKVIIRLRENYFKREIEATQAALEAALEVGDTAPLETRLLELTAALLEVQTRIKLASRGQSFYAGR
jgi:DNA primase